MEKSIQITVSGRVQGVGFRYYTQKVARTRGLKGFVKNLSNGDVYIEAQGLGDHLAEFIKDLKKGPILARVENVLVSEIPENNISSFEVI